MKRSALDESFDMQINNYVARISSGTSFIRITLLIQLIRTIRLQRAYNVSSQRVIPNLDKLIGPSKAASEHH